LVQRIAFLQAAFHIYRENPLFGVGTGDLKVAFAQAYEDVDSPLRDPFRLRAHNQYVTFMLSGGPMALILWLSVLGTLMIVPSYHEPRRPALLFLLILGLSCFTEDTLETQAGITFAGLFIGLFGRRFPPKN
jgi:O-antigen ligase